MIDHASVEAFVEEEAEYYVEKWTTIADPASSRVHWNWPAAVGGMIWMVYRKLYLPLAIVLAISIADMYITFELAESGVFPAAVAFWDAVSIWVYAAVYGSWGNYWYYLKFRTADEAATRITGDTTERLHYLAEKGGTSMLIAGIVLMSLASAAIWIILDV